MTYIKGQTVNIIASFTDLNSTLFDPSTVTLKIYNKRHTKLYSIAYTSSSSEKISTGKYKFIVTLEYVIGDYVLEVIGSTSGINIIHRENLKINFI